MSLFTRNASKEELDLSALRTWATNIAKRIEILERADDVRAVLSSPEPQVTPASSSRFLPPTGVPVPRETVFSYDGLTRVVEVVGMKRGRYGAPLIEGWEKYNDRDGSHSTPLYKCFKADLVSI
jgi:hypothetical protein